jgi:pimeloyl-ACP methyl ester carboxylesterase
MAAHSVAQTPIAIGVSNGAIMAAALLLTSPRRLASAILFHPLSPFWNDLAIRIQPSRPVHPFLNHRWFYQSYSLLPSDYDFPPALLWALVRLESDGRAAFAGKT